MAINLLRDLEIEVDRLTSEIRIDCAKREALQITIDTKTLIRSRLLDVVDKTKKELGKS